MRDLLLLSIVTSAALMALRRPWIGVMLWTWLSLGNPHQAFGWRTATMPLAQIAAVATLIGLLVTREKRNPFDRPPVVALGALMVWVTITLPFSVLFELSLPMWERSMKIFLMVLVTIALIDTRRKLEIFIIVCTGSIALLAVKGGLFTLATGGKYRVIGPGGFIGGNNEMATATIIMIPFLYYLLQQQKNRWIRLGVLGTMALSTISAVGSYSRGGLLAVAAMLVFLWFHSKRRMLGLLIVLPLAAYGLTLLPEHWWGRMETIKTYEEDNSALGRLNAWAFCFNVAKDRLFGGGFIMYSKEMFERYAPDAERIHGSHSIYFQMMGEHGFIGLAIFLSIGVLTWLEARKLVKLSKGRPELSWAGDLGRMIHVSMIGFAVGGAFLGLAYYDFPYNVMAMAVCAMHVVRRSLAELPRANHAEQPAPPGAAVAVPAKAEAAQAAGHRA
jgi:probable O-glycosylation ligase (exosortase A-associated)